MVEILSGCSLVLVEVFFTLLDDGESLFCFGWRRIGVPDSQVEPSFWVFDGSTKEV